VTDLEKRTMFEKSFKIAGRQIGVGEAPYIIAEMSANHNGDLNRALTLVEAAAETGADAVKLQTYTADTMTLDVDRDEFSIHGGLWDGRRLYDLYKEAHTPWDWHEVIFAKGRDLGIAVFSSPFDETAVDFLEGLDAPAYKIASFELVDIPLIERVARTGKPIIMSTGMGSDEEIDEAVEAARNAGNTELALLHCVSAYPAAAEDTNLAIMDRLAARYSVPVGLSDHTLGTTVSVAAVARGACVIEKHFTLRRADGGVDSAFSLEPQELALLVGDCATSYKAVGSLDRKLDLAQTDNLKFRRSLYVVKDIEQGETFSEENIRSVRPGNGMAPKYQKEVLGRKAARKLYIGEALRADMINGWKSKG
jgi:pseudaminic acid synthase